MTGLEYVFPSIRGVQAGREFYVSMCPLHMIPKLFLYNEVVLPPEVRSQRTLNKQRIPEMARYITENEKDYTFSSLTASIDGKIKFEPSESEGQNWNLGHLHIPMDSKFVINDGQHRRAAIEVALKQNPDLGDETISVVFFLDVGLKRTQQMFADLNRYAIRPSPSLGILYEGREELAQVTKQVVERVPIFNELTETERSNISNRSTKLFTLSAIYNATKALLAGLDDLGTRDKVDLAAEYWNEVGRNVPDWQLVRERKLVAAELRRDYVHTHALSLAAFARVGNTLLVSNSNEWQEKLSGLSAINWSRKAPHWTGRAMNAGRLSKRHINIILTANYIKKKLSLPLSAEEKEIEQDFKRGTNGNG